MTPNLQSLLSHLTDVRQTGETQWEAICPAHDDSRPSLCVGMIGGHGMLGVKCQAGCDTKSVMAAINQPMSLLFPPKRTEAAPNSKGSIVATYDYCQQDGTLRFQAVRLDPKMFYQRQPDGDGWKDSVKGCPVLPYRLPELSKADAAAIVFVVEGEKDVDNMQSLGLVATCNAGGAGKWKAAHAKFLADRHVCILPDNDDAGRKHALKVAKSLLGVAASVKIVELPDLPAKGDVSDWIAAERRSA